jgi:hypothetical protein
VCIIQSNVSFLIKSESKKIKNKKRLSKRMFGLRVCLQLTFLVGGGGVRVFPHLTFPDRFSINMVQAVTAIHGTCERVKRKWQLLYGPHIRCYSRPRRLLGGPHNNRTRENSMQLRWVTEDYWGNVFVECKIIINNNNNNNNNNVAVVRTFSLALGFRVTVNKLLDLGMRYLVQRQIMNAPTHCKVL